MVLPVPEPILRPVGPNHGRTILTMFLAELIPALLAVASLNGRATVPVQNAETRPQNGSVTLNSSFNAFIRIACALCPLSRHDRWAVIPEFSIEIPSLRAVRSFNSRSVLPVAFPVSKPLLGAVWIDDGGAVFTVFLAGLVPALLAAGSLNSRSAVAMQNAIQEPHHAAIALNPSLDPVFVFFRHS